MPFRAKWTGILLPCLCATPTCSSPRVFRLRREVSSRQLEGYANHWHPCSGDMSKAQVECDPRVRSLRLCGPLVVTRRRADCCLSWSCTRDLPQSARLAKDGSWFRLWTAASASSSKMRTIWRAVVCECVLLSGFILRLTKWNRTIRTSFPRNRSPQGRSLQGRVFLTLSYLQ